MKQVIDYINEVKFGVNKKESDIKAIDLDLPSKTKWCSCNLGANNPEEVGGYYSWGELTEKSMYIKDTYSFLKNSKLLKYNEDDKLDTLELKDDVANTTLKQKWCIPTLEQCNELIKNTKQQIAEMNGKKGTLFVSLKNDNNYIFIPFGGYKRRELKEFNETGEIWANDLLTRNTDSTDNTSDGFSYNMANIIYIADNINKAELYNESRYLGINIRPVKK